MPSDLVSVARHDNNNVNASDDTNSSHRHESDTLSSIFTAPPSPSPSPPCSRSTSPCRPQHRHRARDNYCCGLLAPVDVESACPSPSHHPHAHSHSLQPHHQNHHISGIGPGTTFWTSPLLGPLLFSNDSSDARDHAANERTFLSYLRLSTYMAVVSVAITLSFHLKSQPTDVELRMARPLGLVFWLLAVACLALGFGNYVNTLNKYSRKAAIVQTGWRTQSVMSLIGLAIVVTCIVLLVVAKIKVDLECDSLSRAASALLFPSSSPSQHSPNPPSLLASLSASSGTSGSYRAADIRCAEKLRDLPLSLWSSMIGRS